MLKAFSQIIKQTLAQCMLTQVIHCLMMAFRPFSTYLNEIPLNGLFVFYIPQGAFRFSHISRSFPTVTNLMEHSTRFKSQWTFRPLQISRSFPSVTRRKELSVHFRSQGSFSLSHSSLKWYAYLTLTRICMTENSQAWSMWEKCIDEKGFFDYWCVRLKLDEPLIVQSYIDYSFWLKDFLTINRIIKNFWESVFHF